MWIQVRRVGKEWKNGYLSQTRRVLDILIQFYLRGQRKGIHTDKKKMGASVFKNKKKIHF